MTLMGGVSVFSILVGILRLKLLAVLLGPAGVGLYGIFMSVLNAGVAVAGLGFNSAGIRQVAKAKDDPGALSDIRWALRLGNLVLGGAACALIWLFRHQIALLVFPDDSHATEIGLLGVGIILSLLAGGRLAVLQGLQHIRAVAWFRVVSGLVATIVGISVVYLYEMQGVIALVILVPASNMVVAWLLGKNLLARKNRLNLASLPPIWRESSKLGFTFMGTASITALSIIAVQMILVRFTGQAAVGLFQAVLILSMHYIGFIFMASRADYYPRLVAVSTNRRRVRFMVNKQTEIGLLIAAPIIVLMVALSDWIIPLLFSSGFAAAVPLQRVWILGDILTIPTMFCAYILIVCNRGGWFFITKLVGAVIYVGLVWMLHKMGYGLTSVAVAKVISEVIVLGATSVAAASIAGFYWHRRVVVLTTAIAAPVAAITILAAWFPLVANLAGIALALGFGAYAFHKIFGTGVLAGRAGRLN